eukprot:COSAG01_NODE_1110_length_11657_cov_5.360616_10_plen_587_part_00
MTGTGLHLGRLIAFASRLSMVAVGRGCVPWMRAIYMRRYLLGVKARADARLSRAHRWQSRMLINCSEVMADDSKPAKEQWTAAFICAAYLYVEVFLFDMGPVIVASTCLLQLQSKSLIFLLAMIPLPFLVQMLFASLLVKVDLTNHSIWILPPPKDAPASSSDSVAASAQDTPKTLPPVPTVPTSVTRGSPPSDPDNRQPADPVTIKVSCDRLCHFDEFDTNRVQMLLPSSVPFPVELKATWWREWLIFFLAFCGATAGFAWSDAGKMALSACGASGLYSLGKTTGYRLHSFKTSCGDPTILSSRALVDLQAQSPKKCAEATDALGLSLFNYGVAGGRFSRRCIAVNQPALNGSAVRPTCPAQLNGATLGLQTSSEWDLYSVLPVAKDLDDCGCKPGFGWASSLGHCASDSTTSADEAQACAASQLDEGELPGVSDNLYALYMLCILGFVILYTLVVSWVEHDLVLPAKLAPCCHRRSSSDSYLATDRKQAATRKVTAAKEKEQHVVWLQARKPHARAEEHSATLAKWRGAIQHVEEINRVHGASVQKTNSHKMHPIWIVVLMVLLMGTAAFCEPGVSILEAVHFD